MFTRFRFPMSCTSSKFVFMISGTRDSKTAFPVAFWCLFRTPCPSSATTMPMTVSAVTEVKIPIAEAGSAYSECEWVASQILQLARELFVCHCLIFFHRIILSQSRAAKRAVFFSRRSSVSSIACSDAQ